MSYMPLEVMAPSAMSPPPNPNLQTAYPQQWYATPNTTTPGQPANPARVIYVSFFQEKSIRLTF